MSGEQGEEVMSDNPAGECEQIEHTADVGLRCSAPTLERLFECTARAMFEIIAPLNNVKPAQTVPVVVNAATVEELFVSWLEELLYIWESRRILLSTFAVKKVASHSLEAAVAGEAYDPKLHEVQSEIKAATYHDLRIERKGDNWEVQIIFDV